jgi:hypothetical protein
MSGEPHPPGWVAGRILETPEAVTAAGRVVAAGDRSNDACLRARRQLEQALGLHAAGRVGAADYLEAATRLEDAGYGAHAETLRAIAATEPELEAARCQWHARRDARPQTVAERAIARWLEDGKALVAEPYREGIDGCYYGLSRLCGDLARAGEFAVVVMTSDRRPQLVAGFADRQRARAWADDRIRREDRPLAAVNVRPESRVSREELLLAPLLRQPARVLDGLPVTAQTWTSDLRAEIFQAWHSAAPPVARGPQPQAVAAALERRMLRAPDEVFRMTGLATAYLGRLLATQVTGDRALAAARSLCEEDQRAVALVADAGAALEELARRAAAAAGPPRSAPVAAPPRPAPGPSGPAPRM